MATVATPSMIDKARELYQSDDVEIDDDAIISDARGEGSGSGIWVSAWVWVREDLLDAGKDGAR